MHESECGVIRLGRQDMVLDFLRTLNPITKACGIEIRPLAEREQCNFNARITEILIIPKYIPLLLKFR